MAIFIQFNLNMAKPLAKSLVHGKYSIEPTDSCILVNIII